MSDMFLEAIISKNIVNKNEKINSKDILSFYKSKLIEFWGIEETDSEFEKYVINSIELTDINKYKDNPFYKNIKISNIKKGKYSLIYDHYEPYELFSYKDMQVEEETYIELNSLSFFQEEFPFIAINKDDVTWMSVTPNEIETMEASINNAHGKVVVYGLGLGYYPYMISLKENVKEITIVENDKVVISIFKRYLLPQFENKNKIKIIEADAFDYMKVATDFDYAFIDLWHDPLDGIELFIKSKQLEKENKECAYWLESSMYLLLRRCFISLLEEQLDSLDESHYQKAENITDKIINRFYKNTKDLVIENKKQLVDLLKGKSLLSLILK